MVAPDFRDLLCCLGYLKGGGLYDLRIQTATYNTAVLYRLLFISSGLRSVTVILLLWFWSVLVETQLGDESLCSLLLFATVFWLVRRIGRVGCKHSERLHRGVAFSFSARPLRTVAFLWLLCWFYINGLSYLFAMRAPPLLSLRTFRVHYFMLLFRHLQPSIRYTAVILYFCGRRR